MPATARHAAARLPLSDECVEQRPGGVNVPARAWRRRLAGTGRPGAGWRPTEDAPGREPALPTEELFRDDAYLTRCDAIVTAAGEGWVELDRSVFYPAAGGQPGDLGVLRPAGGGAIEVVDTRKGEAQGVVRHLLAEGSPAPAAGTALVAEIDWPRRHRLMRMHSALHLLCRAVDGVVTGGQVGDGKGRLDFDIPEPVLDKEAIAARLDAWVAEDRAIRALWIDEAELESRPELVRTLTVRPPVGQGRVRLVEIEGVDLQACGGTHVRSTGEIGRLKVDKIEKKGRQNRRVAISFAE
jgi:misacylated tRNA(Ala) deacylase